MFACRERPALLNDHRRPIWEANYHCHEFAMTVRLLIPRLASIGLMSIVLLVEYPGKIY